MSCRLRLLHATTSVLPRIGAAGSEGVAGARREQRSQGSHGLRALCVPTTGRDLSSCTSRMRCARLAGLLRLFVVTYDAGQQTSSLPSSSFSSSDTSRKLQPVVVFLGNDERNK